MIKNQLKHILIDKNMSLNQLAEETGITYSMIYDFANMKRQSVKYETVDAICKLLQVTPGDILTYEPEWAKTAVTP